MRREDEAIMQADRELASFPYYCQKLLRAYDDLVDVEKRIDVFGVSSPRIMSTEEAKYQKGTQIYSDLPMLELFTKADELKEEIRLLRGICTRTRRKLIGLDLDDEELTILYYRYERNMTYEQIAYRMNYSINGVRWKPDKIRMGFSVW